MRICCVISSLGSGGAERVMVELCRAWANRGDIVTLVTLDSAATDFYALPEGVERIALNVTGQSHSVRMAVHASLKRRRAIRDAIVRARPQVVVSFTDRTNVLVLLATYGLNVPVVISERIDPRLHNPGTAWRALRKVTYRRADALVVQTESVAEWARDDMSLSRVFVIANPVRPASATLPDDADRRAEVVAVGRLVHAKGFDLLVRAFAHLHSEFPEWRLVVYGEGPSRDSLVSLAASLMPDGVASFPGRTPDTDGVLRNARVFALSSRNEGFPNVLLEAMTNGCACVAADCPSGPADLLAVKDSGLLVVANDHVALSNGLQQLLGNAPMRRALGAVAAASTQRFSIDVILTQWDQVFRAISERARRAA